MSAQQLAFSFQPSVVRHIAFRLTLFITFVTCALLLVTSPARAQEGDTPAAAPETTTDAIQPLNASNYGPDKHILYTLMNMGGYAAGCLGEGSPLFGGDCIDMVGQIGPDGTAQGATPVLVDSSVRSGGALGMLGGAMVALGTTAPTSPVQYLATVGESFGIRPAYAQVSGSGNSVIQPILKLWQLTRNIAYFGFILIFIAIGFMIMFRQKLNPQTVISAQNALPGVVVALILVTFSYFIAALIIDFGFITTQLTGRLLVANQLAKQDVINETLRTKNVFDIFGSFIAPPAPFSETSGPGGLADSASDLDTIAGATKDSLSVLNQGMVGTMITGLVVAGGCYYGGNFASSFVKLEALPTGANAPVGGVGPVLQAGRAASLLKNFNPAAKTAWGLGCVGGGAGGAALLQSGILFYGIGIILYVVLLIALIIAMFKTFFELIKAYVTLMIQTVAAPLIIMSGAIPGQGGAFGGWLKTMFANILIFPAVFAAFFFAAFIMGRPDNTFGIIAGSSGNFAIQSTVPLLGGLSGNFIKLILVYGILLIIPSIPGEVKKAFKVQDSPLGGVALAGVAAGAGAGKTLVSRPLQPWLKQSQAWKEAQLKQEATALAEGARQPGRLTRLLRPFT